MASEQLKNIFLSASIPSPDRHPNYYDTADIIAIRDAVRAFATVVVPRANLIWGGHPSITPMINYILKLLKVDSKSHVTLYQSMYFENDFPSENENIDNVIFTTSYPSLSESITHMRNQMILGNQFVAGVFIGGMEGINDEFEIFKKAHPLALILPVASTGAAAKQIFDSSNQYDGRLLTDYAYMSLFNDLLSDVIQTS